MLYLLVIIGAIFTQSNWVSGPGVQGPVPDWDKAFYQYDSVTYNIQWQISPVVESGTVDYTAWEKHIIDSDANIECHSIWPADFDNDGDIDLAGWKGKANQLVLYENDGSNGFTPVATYTGPGACDWGMIYGADLDNNGDIDVVVPGGGGLKWYQNNGEFNFTPHSISMAKGYFFVYGSNIDNDNDTDLVVGNMGSPTEIWENTGGSFSLKQNIPYGAWRVKFADLNGDGWVDLLIDDAGKDAGVRIFHNDGAGTFFTITTFWGGLYSTDALWIRDMDNDDDLDIICGVMDTLSPSSARVLWKENSGDGINYVQHTVYHSGSPGGDVLHGDGCCAEDFDFDGKTDIASGFWERLSWFRQIGPDNFTTYKIDDPSSKATHWIYPIKLGGGTCFQSGNVDLLVCWQGEFAWYENKMVQPFAHGWLTSSILELDSQQRQLRWFGWEACVPATSTLAFYWRADSTAGGIVTKPWIGPHYSIVGASIKDSIDLLSTPCYRYFQYKTEFWPDGNDAAVVHELWLTDTTCGGVGVEEELKVESLELRVFPNPFIQSTVISYQLPAKSTVSLNIYDLAGKLVKTLVNENKKAGNYTVRWNGRDKVGKKVASGIYFYRMEVYPVKGGAGEFKITRKLTILR